MSLEKEIARLTNALLAMNQILLHEAPQDLKDRLAELPPEVAAATEDEQEQEQKPKPAKKKKATKKASATKSPAAKAAAAREESQDADEEVTREELRELLMRVDAECGRAQVMATLKQFDATNLGKVDPSQYILFKRALEEVLKMVGEGDE